MSADRSSTGMMLILIILMGASGMLALQFHRQKGDLVEQLTRSERRLQAIEESLNAAQSPSPDAQAPQKANDSVYDLINQLAEKNKRSPTTPKPSTRTTPRPPRRSTAAVSRAAPPSTSAAGTRYPLKRMIDSLTERVEFFDSVEPADMTSGQQAQHAALKKRLIDVHAFLSGINSSPDNAVTEADRDKISQQIQELEPLLQSERNIMFHMTGRNLGYDEKTARWFADYMAYVYDMTTLGPPFQRVAR
jgi:hypothetical protein